MAINWRLRESVFRLLAAVYAELGEAAVSPYERHEACPLAELINAQFKGRYASIAKFYGDDATYDAVKSFFAKEIAKAAEDLGRQNPGAQRTQRTMPQKSSSSRQSRRTMHLDFNDQDISFVSEREVEAHSRHALQRPPKRPRLYQSPFPVEDEGDTSTESQALPEFSPEGLPNGGNQGFRAVIGQPPSPPPQLNGHGSRDPREFSIQQEYRIPPAPRELTSASTDPSYIPSPSPPAQEPTRRRAPPKKRTYKEVSEYDLEYQTISSSPQSGSRRTQEPTSFGYVSNAGFFRCALCFSQLSSQDALDKHEALSKLHQRNLQDPAIVSKGRAKLAQVTALPQQSSASPAAFGPLGLGAFSERGEPSTNGHLAHNDPSRPDVSYMLNQPLRRQEILANSSRAIDTIEVHPRTASAPQISLAMAGNGNFHASTMEPVEEMVVGKGKQRGSPYPDAATQTYILAPANPVLQAPTPVDETQLKRPNAVDSAPNEADDNPSRTAPTKPHNMKPPSRLRPLEVAEILRLTGIRLAEKYISEHPDLIAQTMSRVQREFTAASASTTASVGPSGNTKPTRGSAKVVDTGPAVKNGSRDVDVVILD